MSNQKVTPEYIEKLRTSSEQELRELDDPWPDTLEELNEVIAVLSARDHTYGTCVYAMSISAAATFNYQAHVQGCTGFQAGCAGMDMIRRTRSIDGPFRIVDYSNMLYSQYADKFSATITKSTWEWLQEEAAKRLKEADEDGHTVHEDVRKHWQSVVDGKVPFGYAVED